MKRYALLALGIGIGLAVTEYLLLKEAEKKLPPVKEDGLYADIHDTTVHIYKVENGRLTECVEKETFATREEALDWVIQKGNVKLLF